MGRNTASCTQEEDIASKEEAKVHGRKGFEGCHKLEQMFCLRSCEEGAFAMPYVCSRYVVSMSLARM
jgi:hypothetical protein